MSSSPRSGAKPCLLCGSHEDPTLEHIIPQTLWLRFGIEVDDRDGRLGWYVDEDGNRLDHRGPINLVRWTTWLCDRHNGATSRIHTRTDMLDMLADGEPINAQSLKHLGDWIVWVGMLLGLAQGRGVIEDEQVRQILRDRFDGKSTGNPPREMRVYAARIKEYDKSPRSVVPHLVFRHDDPRVLLAQGRPNGLSVRTGNMGAAWTIQLGKFSLIVLGRTFRSGDGHNGRLDSAAAEVGHELIWPLPTPVPALEPRVVNASDVANLFTVVPLPRMNVGLVPANLVDALFPLAEDAEAFDDVVARLQATMGKASA